jgi:hypothetical protein
MKLTATLTLTCILFSTGCLKEEDLQAHRAEVDARLEALDRYSSYHSDPVVFEIHDINIDGEDITGVIRSLDERIKGKALYLDAIIDVFSGGNKVKESSEFLYLNDGIGKLDTSLWLSSEDKKKIDSNKGIEIKLRLHGWGEMFPGVVNQK